MGQRADAGVFEGLARLSRQVRSHFINPRHACAARVTVVVRVRLSVCLSVCPLVGNSLLKCLFITYSTGNEDQWVFT